MRPSRDEPARPTPAQHGPAPIDFEARGNPLIQPPDTVCIWHPDAIEPLNDDALSKLFAPRDEALDFDAVPEWIRTAIDRVLPDLQQPTEIALRFAMFDDGGMLAIVEGPGYSAFVISAWTAGPAFDVHLADQLQDVFLEQPGARWSEARPRCPGHPHPLVPEEHDAEAWWVFPETQQRVVRVGSYRHSEGQR